MAHSKKTEKRKIASLWYILHVFCVGIIFISLSDAFGAKKIPPIKTKSEIAKNQQSSRLKFIVTEETSSLCATAIYLYGQCSKYKDIASWNNIAPPYNIIKGQQLILKELPIPVEKGKFLLRQAWRKKLGLLGKEIAYGKKAAPLSSAEESVKAEPKIVVPEIAQEPAPEPAPEPTSSVPEFAEIKESEIVEPAKPAEAPVGALPELSVQAPETALPERDTQHLPVKKGPQLVKYKSGLSYNSVNYKRTGIRDFSAKLLNLNTSYRAGFSRIQWGWGADGLFTLLMLDRNRTDTSARFFKINGHISYSLPWPETPWKLSVLGGAYYETTFTSGKSIGYRNITGPSTALMLSRRISSVDSVSANFKVSPIVDGLVLLPFTSRELAWGASWSHYLDNGHPITLDFRATEFKLLLNRVLITNSTYGMGLSYWW